MQNESGVNLIHCINYKTAIAVGGEISNGKVIGEFVCDRIDGFLCYDYVTPTMVSVGKTGCLSPQELIDYIGNKTGYAWHITNLVIYDKPKELWNFKKECIGYVRNDEDWCLETCPEYELGGCDGRHKPIYTPPMSWCYVEELGV
jgi:hypothetical protein